MLVANKKIAINKVVGIKSDNKLIEKYRKLLKTKKLSKDQILYKLKNLKVEKLSKFQKLTKENGLNFLAFDARMTFNCLWLTLTKALILWHFNLEYYI